MQGVLGAQCMHQATSQILVFASPCVLCLPGLAPPWEADLWQHLSPAALEEASVTTSMSLCGQNSAAACRGHGDQPDEH